MWVCPYCLLQWPNLPSELEWDEDEIPPDSPQALVNHLCDIHGWLSGCPCGETISVATDHLQRVIADLIVHVNEIGAAEFRSHVVKAEEMKQINAIKKQLLDVAQQRRNNA